MTAKVLIGVALVAAAVFLSGLGAAPFVDPPEGFHAAVALEMARAGDWGALRVDGVRYFDKPPLLYWLMAAAFSTLGVSAWTARLGSALPAVGVAVVTAWIGLRLGSARLGFLSGLIVTANLEVFVFARLVKPDLLFVLFILLAFAGFIEAYGGGRRGGLLLFYGALGGAVLAKDLLGAVGPLVVVGAFLAASGKGRPWARWLPGGGLALLVVLVVPWYALTERASPGFLWYTIVDNHVLNFLRHRAFPDEDVPLGAVEFLAVTAVGFLPWTLALPQAVWRAMRRRPGAVEDRVWFLLALWVVVAVGFFTLSPFKLPHYGLPAFPAMALLVARQWSDALDGAPGAPRASALLAAAVAVLLLAAVTSALAWQGHLPLPAGALPAADVTARNMTWRGQEVPVMAARDVRPILGTLAGILAAGAAAVTGAAVRRRPLLGLGVVLAVMVASLSATVPGFALFARSRAVEPLGEVVALRAGPGDVLAHEGPIENSASWLLGLDRPVKIVDGRQSSLALGATFPEARDTFWSAARLAEAWRGGPRVFLLSAVRPGRSVVRELPAGNVHLLAEGGGRWLYSNRP